MGRPVKPCGTRAAYARGCHCDPCSEASRKYHRELRIGVGPADGTVEKLREITPPGDWINRAACAGLPSELFFPQGSGAVPEEIRIVCHDCDVRTPCLDWALQNRINEGWWGGTSPNDRGALRRTQPHMAGT